MIPEINTRRRNVLKWILFGVGAFILGKIVGPSVNLFSRSETLGEGATFKNFRVVENDKELKLYNRTGDEIFIIEKDPK